VRLRKDDLVQLRISRREKSRWAAFAAEADVSVGELIRRCVRDRLRDWPRMPPSDGQPEST
jgi:hypothetical protein